MLAGRVFVASMLTMGTAATHLTIIKHQNSNIGGGILTFYLVGTAWLTARRRDGEISRWDWVALVIPLTIGLLTWMNGINVLRSGRTSRDGVPVGMMFFFGSICLLAAAGDVRILLHGGVSGAAKGTRRRSGQGQRVSNARLTRRRANSPTRRTTYRGSDALSATAAITTEKALAGWLGQTPRCTMAREGCGCE